LWRSSSLLLRRTLATPAIRTFTVSSVKCGGGAPQLPFDHHAGKVPSDDCTMPEDVAHSVGVERWERLQREAGNDDPFGLKPIKRGKGTFEEPTCIPSHLRARLVGCCCGDEETMAVIWINLHKGEPKRCHCGHWYKLVDAPPTDMPQIH